MTDIQKEAREIVDWCYVEIPISGACSNEIKEQLERLLVAALQKQRDELIEECAKKVESVDSLEAIADWENNDQIAYAVQDFCAKAIRQLAEKK